MSEKNKKAITVLSYLILGCISFVIINYSAAKIFNVGLKKYYCLYPAHVLFIGHSMTEMGIDKKMIEDKLNRPIAKYCMNGAGVPERLIMLKHYIETVKTTPEVVVYDVSSRIFSSDLSNNPYALFLPFISESAVINEYLKKEMPYDQYYTKKLIPMTRYEDTRLGAVVRGYLGKWETMTLKKFDPVAFEKQIKQGVFWKITFDRKNMEYFDETLEYLTSQNIKVILIAFPNNVLLNNAEPEKYREAMNILQTKAESYPGVTLLDLNPLFANNHSIFADPIHLNRKGQQIISEYLADYLLKSDKL